MLTSLRQSLNYFIVRFHFIIWACNFLVIDPYCDDKPEAVVLNSLAPEKGSFVQTIGAIAKPICKKAFGGNTIETTCIAETSSYGQWHAVESCKGSFWLVVENIYTLIHFDIHWRIHCDRC